jgi:exonuclease III
MTSPTRISTLENFLHASDIDILLVQEVTKHVLHDFRSYSTIYNNEANGKDTAIIAKEGIILENQTRLPSGRAIAAKFKECCLINVYAPSGTARRQERETFFTSELPHLLTTTSWHLLMAGDFKCTLQLGESTGTLNHSRCLIELLRGMELQDAWKRTTGWPGYTDYSPLGGSRLDRIYLTKDLINQKQALETIVAAFTDHLAVKLHLKMDAPILRMRRGYWKLDCTLLEDGDVKDQITTLWGRLQQKRCYPDAPMWWDRYCKRRLTPFMQRAQAERHKEHRAMENFYFSCIYELLQGDTTHAVTRAQLNRLKAKLVCLQQGKLQKMMLDSDAADS